VNEPDLESRPPATRMDTRFPQKLLTFSGKYGDVRVSKSAEVVVLVEFFELAQSGGAEQNSVSICIVTLREATFFNRWSRADGEKSDQITSLQMGIEELKL
jgi:hypothetical protein